MLTTTYKILMAASRDAGNRQMVDAGRTVWNEEDYNFAAAEFARLSGVAVLDDIAE